MKTLLYFVHTHGWLGHTKRISNIISRLNKDFPWVYRHIVLISWNYQERWFFLDPSIRCIFLPSYQSVDISYIDFAQKKNNLLQKLRKNIYHNLVQISGYAGLIVEHFPFWRFQIKDEILFLIQVFREKNPHSFVFSSVREIFPQEDISKHFFALFDKILIHWPIKGKEENFSEEEKKKIIYTWYIIPPLEKSKQEKHILISLWWWRDWENQIEECIQKIALVQYVWKIYIACGALYNEHFEKKLVSLFPDWSIIVKAYFENYEKLKSSASLFVTQWWYNDFFEAYFLDIPLLLIPRSGEEEQQLRAQKFLWNDRWVFLFSEQSRSTLSKLVSWEIIFTRDKKDFDWALFTATILHTYKTFPFLKLRLSNACNASCDMCWVIRRPRVNNNFFTIQKTIKEFSDIGGEVINFTGWEPTIYPWFSDLVFFAKNLGLQVSLSSHWYKLHQAFVDKLSQKGQFLIDFIDISVDALYEKHDAIRWISGLFNSLVETIKTLQKYHTKMHINHTLRADNIDETLSFIDFFYGLWIDSFSLSFIDFSPFHDTHFLLPSKEQILRFYKHTKKILQDYPIQIVFTPDNNGQDIDIFVNSISNHHNFPKKETSNCEYIQKKKEIRINETGDISPCCEIDDYSPNIWNINSKSLFEILWAPYHNFLKRTFPSISPACKSCKIYIPKL